VLLSIFRTVLGFEGYLCRGNIKTLFMLKTVCRHWMQTISDSPVMYSRFDDEGLGSYCLKKSGSHLLSFRINPASRSSLVKMIECSDRWENADMCINIELLSYLDPIKDRLNNLESLIMKLYSNKIEYNAGYVGSQVSKVLESAPNLRTLTYYGRGEFWKMLSFPWRQITRLELGNSYSEDVTGIIAQSINLECCTIGDARIFSSNYILEFPKLQSLEVIRPNLEFFGGRMDSPRLQNLRIEVCGKDVSRDDVIGFLCGQKLVCNLRILYIGTYFYDFTREDIMRLADRYPAIESLTITARSFYWEVIDLVRDSEALSSKIALKEYPPGQYRRFRRRVMR